MTFVNGQGAISVALLLNYSRCVCCANNSDPGFGRGRGGAETFPRFCGVEFHMVCEVKNISRGQRPDIVFSTLFVVPFLQKFKLIFVSITKCFYCYTKILVIFANVLFLLLKAEIKVLEFFKIILQVNFPG